MSSKKKEPEQAYRPGVGLDIGTMNIVSARRETGDETRVKRVRDAFLDLDMTAKRSLKMSRVDYIEKDDRLIVIGDSVLTMANLFKREARRPLSKGVISAGEIDAQEILSILTHFVLEDPVQPGEHCFYSVPSSPINDQSQDILYHTEVFRRIVEEHGYTAHPTNEAMAIIYSQAAEDMFSGLAVSFGAGMCNVALSYQATQAMDFSVSDGGGGDWIDAQSARAVGRTAAQMCAIKEKGLDLSKPKNREQEAIVLYTKALIDHCLKNIAAQFEKRRGEVELLEPIPFIVSGGTSKAHGFMDVFKQQFAKIQKAGFPIDISDVRPAVNPLTAVAEGLLVLASEEHEEE
jgi:hypothetical protein